MFRVCPPWLSLSPSACLTRLIKSANFCVITTGMQISATVQSNQRRPTGAGGLGQDPEGAGAVPGAAGGTTGFVVMPRESGCLPAQNHFFAVTPWISVEGVFPLEELQGNVSLCKGSKEQRAVANWQSHLSLPPGGVWVC